jgi:NADH dehydrogenase
VERKVRVIMGWILAFFMGRDTTQLIDLDNPRGAFVAAATPAPKPAAAAPAPAASTPDASAGPAQPSSVDATSVDAKQSVTADAK